MASIATPVGAYLRDGFIVWLFPVTAFRSAAERNLPWLIIVAVLTVVTALSFLLDVSSFALLGEGVIPDEIAASLPATFLFRYLQVLVFFFAAGAALFAATLLFGGKAQLSRFYSAYLIFPSLGVFVSALFPAALLLMLLTSSDTPEMLSLLSPAREIGSVLLAAILIGYTIIAARFGGDISWLRAVGASAVYLVAMIFLQVAYTYSVHVLGISAIPSEVARWLFFGAM